MIRFSQIHSAISIFHDAVLRLKTRHLDTKHVILERRASLVQTTTPKQMAVGTMLATTDDMLFQVQKVLLIYCTPTRLQKIHIPATTFLAKQNMNSTGCLKCSVMMVPYSTKSPV